jgi:hypothetical protein
VAVLEQFLLWALPKEAGSVQQDGRPVEGRRFTVVPGNWEFAASMPR